jgi:hypothetical protein
MLHNQAIKKGLSYRPSLSLISPPSRRFFAARLLFCLAVWDNSTPPRWEFPQKPNNLTQSLPSIFVSTT